MSSSHRGIWSRFLHSLGSSKHSAKQIVAKDLKLSAEEKSKLPMKKIALYGSSLNPPTRAHLEIVQYFAGLPQFDEIWILPVYKHIFAKNSTLISYEDRLALTKLAFEHLPNVKVSEIEKVVSDYLNKDKKPEEFIRHGTYDVVVYMLEHLFPNENVEISFILGADTYKDLCDGKWTDTEALVNLVKLQVMNRDDMIPTVLPDFPATLHSIKISEDNVSSTAARKCNNVNELKRICPESVAEEIANRHLYGFSQSP